MGNPEESLSVRSIPKEHPYDPRSLKPLAKSLFATSVALGHALSAFKHFSRLKSSTISPDGKIGGRGYVLGVDDVRKKLWEASEALSLVSDALYDEIQGPHWKPRLSQLDENDAEDVSRFVEESRGILTDPEEDADARIKDIEEENDDVQIKTASIDLTDTFAVYRQNSNAFRSVVATDPYPRVTHRGPGEGPGGSFNPPEDCPNDPGSPRVNTLHGPDYDYADLHTASSKWAASVLPNDPGTPTDASSFGLGLESSPDAVLHRDDTGAHSGLPGNPWYSSGTPKTATSMLPGDNSNAVARLDYYRGDTGNVRLVSPLESEIALPKSYTYEDLNTVRLPNGTPGLR